MEQCNLGMFEESLANKRPVAGYDCDYSDAVQEMSNIFDYLVALAANKGRVLKIKKKIDFCIIIYKTVLILDGNFDF